MQTRARIAVSLSALLFVACSSVARADTATTISLSPTSLSFVPQNVGETSAPQVLTLTNTGSSALNITSITASGDYTRSTTCGASLAAGGKCVISVTFAPTTLGTRIGSVTIISANASTYTLSVTGQGMAIPIAASCSIKAAPSSIIIGGTATLTASCTTYVPSFSMEWGGGTCEGMTGFTCTVSPATTTTYTVNDGSPGNMLCLVSASITGGSTSSCTKSGTATVTVSTTPPISSTDCLFNWAERTLPQYFAPPVAASTTLAPYYFRYYTDTSTYLATMSTDNHIWVLGPASGNKPLDVGPITGLLTAAGCSQ